MWSSRVLDAIGPHLAASVETRQDAKESALEKFARTTSRPANNAVGTTGRDLTPIERVNQLGIENTKFLRSGMRQESLDFLRAAREAQRPIEVAVHSDGTIVLTDGRHRLAIAKEQGATEIEGLVRTYDAELNTVSLEPATLSIASRAPVDTATARRNVKDSLIRLKQEARDAGKGQTRLIDTVSTKVDKSNAREFERVVGINAKQLSAPISASIDQFRETNVDLITSIPEDMLDEVGDVIDEAWTAGARVETLSASIQERFDVTESRADLIARDQTLKLNANLAQSRAQSAGLTRYVWSTSGQDERVRGNPSGLYPNPSKTGRVTPDHYHLDGKTFSYDNPPVVDERTGRTANPGEDYQCRCTAAPVLDFLEDNADAEDE